MKKSLFSIFALLPLTCFGLEEVQLTDCQSFKKTESFQSSFSNTTVVLTTGVQCVGFHYQQCQQQQQPLYYGVDRGLGWFEQPRIERSYRVKRLRPGESIKFSDKIIYCQ